MYLCYLEQQNFRGSHAVLEVNLLRRFTTLLLVWSLLMVSIAIADIYVLLL